MKYLIRYGMNISREEDASFNATTLNTSKVLTLSVPEGSPDMVVYNIWIAVVAESQEQGNFTMLTIQYSSESGLPRLNICCIVSTTTELHVCLLFPPTEPMAPKSVNVMPLSCQSVNVSWTPSTNNGGLPLTGYTVRYGDGGQQRMVGNVTSAMLEGLAPNTTYNIAVAAKNVIGEGTESQSYRVLTRPRRLGTFVIARALTSDTIMINTTLGIEERFSNCTLPNSQHGRTFSTPPMKVLQLQPDTNYTVVCDVYDSSSTTIPCIYINTSVLTSELALTYKYFCNMMVTQQMAHNK